MRMKEISPAPVFPLRDYNKMEIALGVRDESAYLTADQLGDWYGFDRTPFHSAAATFFYDGGTLASVGLRVKPGIDQTKVYQALSALLRSFTPSHQVKIGTVAVALANWCDKI